MKNEILASNILPVGSKFVANNKTTDNIFGPGTTGFISYIKGYDYDFPNIVYANSVILRRGKSGKERLDISELSFPIFSPDTDDDKLSEVLPNKDKKSYVNIDQAPQAKNIAELSSIDFIGWALSMVYYVRRLSVKAEETQRSIWPSKDKDIINVFYNSVRQLYCEDPSMVKNDYATAAMRKDFVEKMRLMETALLPYSLMYVIKLAKTEVAAICNLSQHGVDASGTKEAFEQKVKDLINLPCVGRIKNKKLLKL